MPTAKNKYADVPLRIKGWAIILSILGICCLNRYVLYGFFMILSIQAFREYLSLENLPKKWIGMIFPLLIFEFYGIYTHSYEVFLILGFCYALAMGIILKKIKSIPIGIIAMGIGLGQFPFIVELSENYIIGLKYLFFLLILTECNDIFQYLTGKSVGKNALCPTLSPNKTWEGWIGGIILTALLSIFIGKICLPQQSMGTHIILGIGIAIFGVLGDLWISALKRKAKVKDTGNLIPGHGGLLDRMDSLLWVSPLYYHILKIIINT